MSKNMYAIPLEIQKEINKKIDVFNKKYMSKSNYKYCAIIKGKFIYLMWQYEVAGEQKFDKISRLTYDGNLNDMDFAIFRYSREKYDATAMFPGDNYINGTLEGAMKAGLKAYDG